MYSHVFPSHRPRLSQEPTCPTSARSEFLHGATQALAVALKQAMAPEFKTYTQQALESAGACPAGEHWMIEMVNNLIMVDNS